MESPDGSHRISPCERDLQVKATRDALQSQVRAWQRRAQNAEKQALEERARHRQSQSNAKITLAQVPARALGCRCEDDVYPVGLGAVRGRRFWLTAHREQV